MPLEAAERDVRTAEAYFVGVGLGYALIPSFSVPLLLCACRVEGLSLELEGKFGSRLGCPLVPNLAKPVKSPVYL
jgi:hypothetical protein